MTLRSCSICSPLCGFARRQTGSRCGPASAQLGEAVKSSEPEAIQRDDSLLAESPPTFQKPVAFKRFLCWLFFCDKEQEMVTQSWSLKSTQDPCGSTSWTAFRKPKHGDNVILSRRKPPMNFRIIQNIQKYLLYEGHAWTPSSC